MPPIHAVSPRKDRQPLGLDEWTRSNERIRVEEPLEPRDWVWIGLCIAAVLAAYVGIAFAMGWLP
jgi:hypothetical protein